MTEDQDSPCLCESNCKKGCGVTFFFKSLGAGIRPKVIQNSPNSLFYLSLDWLVDHLECLIDTDPHTNEVKLKEGVVLYGVISDALFKLRMQKSGVLDDKILKIFKIPETGKLSEIHLPMDINLKNDKDFLLLLTDELVKLEFDEGLTFSNPDYFWNHLNNHCINLQVFSIHHNINNNFTSDTSPKKCYSLGTEPFQLQSPKLRSLSLQHFLHFKRFLPNLITPLKELTHLELSECFVERDYEYLVEIPNLTSLVLHGMHLNENAWKSIEKLKKLQHLDVSFSVGDKNRGAYNRPIEKLESLIENLPNLTSLDISGTNLDGEDEEKTGSIVALKSRVNNPLEFLGLYSTKNRACLRDNIPAMRISGNKNLSQLFSSASAFLSRPGELTLILNEFFRFRIEQKNVYNVVELVFTLIDMHDDLHTKGIKLLTYVLKENVLQPPVKMRVIRRILDIKYSHFKIAMNRYYVSVVLKRHLKTAEDMNLVARLLMGFLKYSFLDQNHADPAMKKCYESLYFVRFVFHFLEVVNKQTHSFGEGEFAEHCVEFAACGFPYSCFSFWNFIQNVCRTNMKFFNEFIVVGGIHLFDLCILIDPHCSELLHSAIEVFVLATDKPNLLLLMNEKFLNLMIKLLDNRYSSVKHEVALILNRLLNGELVEWTIQEPNRETVLEKKNLYLGD